MNDYDEYGRHVWQCHQCNAYYLDDHAFARHSAAHRGHSNGGTHEADSARRNVNRADMRAMQDDLVDLLADLGPRNSIG